MAGNELWLSAAFCSGVLVFSRYHLQSRRPALSLFPEMLYMLFVLGFSSVTIGHDMKTGGLLYTLYTIRTALTVTTTADQEWDIRDVFGSTTDKATPQVLMTALNSAIQSAN